MKSSTMTMMIAAAALTVAAGSASAQSFKAEIPLTFKAGNAVMVPGSYAVNVSGDGKLIQIRNAETQKSVVMLSVPGGDVPKAWRATDKPVISFACVEGSCSLSRMWNGKDSSDYRFPAPRNAHGERVAELVVTLEKAE